MNTETCVKMYRCLFKRLLDVIISLFIIIVLSPLYVILSVVLCFANKGYPFFVQPRVGKNQCIFKLIKFKTMNDKKDSDGNLLVDVQRLTKVGRLLRNTSLDEIPQLINVIKGDMSLVGPRPLLVEYLPLYNKTQSRRHEVRPGITGWAQVKGRNTLSWKQKFDYDIWYVDHYDFWIDIKIVGMTILKVLKSEGVSSSPTVTMEKFKGN